MNLSIRDIIALPDSVQKRGLLAASRSRAIVAATQTNASPKKAPAHVTGQMNATERSYADRLDILKVPGDVDWWLFEAVTFRLNMPDAGRSRRFTPDFVVSENGKIYCDEIKGGFVREDATLKFDWARQQFEMFVWRMWQKTKTGWEKIR